MTSSVRRRPSGLLLTFILSAVAVTSVGCGGSGKSAPTTSAQAVAAGSTTSAASSTSAAPPQDQTDLTGTWTGHYSGADNGTLTIVWHQSGWKQRSRGVFDSNLDGSIKLSSQPGTLSIHGTVHTNCPQQPCNVPDAIKFDTVGGGGITYEGKLGHPDISGDYRTATGASGSWSANQIGAP
jgi:hypothetical protein